jgi:ATP-dependent DNA helicase RecG
VIEFRDLDAALEAIRRGAQPREVESDRIEFKQEDPDPRRMLELITDAVVCLANAEGGAIMVGVADTVPNGRSPFVGVSSRITVDAVRHGIFDRTRPTLSVPVRELHEDGARLMLITVPKGVVFYANATGTATRRVGKTCAPFSPEEQRQAAAARGQTDWSATPVSAGHEALSADEISRLRRLLALAGREDLERADDSKLLRDLRLVTVDGEVTRAGLLLLGRESELARLIPTHGYAYQYRGSPGSESQARVRGNRPILAAVDLLLQAVSVRSQVHSINVARGVQLQIADYPPEAIRELVVNALVHRDYELDGAVDIEQAPESATITSPGGLVYGVTPENILTHPSTPRHRLLLETVTTLQVAERSGQGIDRAYRELLRAGKAPPTILDDGFHVRVLVPGGTGNDSFARFVADLDEALARDVEVLLALSYLRERRNLNAPTLGALAQRSSSEAQAVLDRLAHAALVEPSRRTASKAFPTYGISATALASLGRAVRYHFRQTDDVDRKVIAQVAEYGHVTNQTLRRLFDLDVNRARDLLRDLQQRGLVKKLDKARGGPGIRYGPGRRFPPSERPRRRAHAGVAEDAQASLEIFADEPGNRQPKS